MSSILTNNGAMVALQTLKSVSNNLKTTQDQISTGKKVSTAKDNAAVWAISTVMQSDVSSFQSISDSLSLGQSTVSVGANAAQQVSSLLDTMKTKIVAAQESNVDRSKIQADVKNLRDQIKSVVGAAQFNGLNLLKGTEDVNVMASLDRNSNNGVSVSTITVARENLESGAAADSTRGGTAETIASATTTATLGGASLGVRTNTTQAMAFSGATALEAVDAATLSFTVGNSTVSMKYSGATGTKTQLATQFNAAFQAFKTGGTWANQAASSGGSYDAVALTVSGAGGAFGDVSGFSTTRSGDTVTITNTDTTRSLTSSFATIDDDSGTGSSTTNLAASNTGTLAAATAGSQTLTIAGTPAANETVTLGVGSTNISYVVKTGDDATAIATGLSAAIVSEGISGVSATNSSGAITLTNTTASAVALTKNVTGSSKVTVDDSSLAAASGTTYDSGTLTFKAGSVSEGNSYRITLGSENIDYVARSGDTLNDVVTNLSGLVKLKSSKDLNVTFTTATDPTTTAPSITIANKTSSSVALSATYTTAGTKGGGLELLDDIDVTTAQKASGSLDLVNGLIQKSVNSAAQFGSDQTRLKQQSDFIGQLTDGMKSGIGSLVDADMEAASARLQALQVQNQLATQALSIANQAPQSLLSLFR